jgi:glycosyltransferase involved in cell wall biosynthesis
MRKKILAISGSFPPDKCGIGDYTQNLLNSLQEWCSVYLITSNKHVVNTKLNLINIGNWNLISLIKLIRLIIKLEPDFIHIQYPTNGYKNSLLPLLVPFFFSANKKKFFVTFHEPLSKYDLLKFLLLLFIPAKIIIVRNNYLREINFLFRKFLQLRKLNFVKSGSNIKVYSDPIKKNVIEKKIQIHNKKLILFFGFVYPHKGLELLMSICNCERDHILIASELDEKNDYHAHLKKTYFENPNWSDNTSFLGYQTEESLSYLISIADAVVLPYRSGAGSWNTTLNCAENHKTFILTTTKGKIGYDTKRNIYFSKIDDTNEMKLALNKYISIKSDLNTNNYLTQWTKIARRHLFLYERG